MSSIFLYCRLAGHHLGTRCDNLWTVRFNLGLHSGLLSKDKEDDRAPCRLTPCHRKVRGIFPERQRPRSPGQSILFMSGSIKSRLPVTQPVHKNLGTLRISIHHCTAGLSSHLMLASGEGPAPSSNGANCRLMVAQDYNPFYILSILSTLSSTELHIG